MKGKFIFSIALLLCTVFGAAGQTYHVFSKKIPRFVYGTWEIYRFEENRGTIHDPKVFLGKKVRFSNKSFTCDKNFLFFNHPCRLYKYDYTDFRPEEGDINSGFLIWTENGFKDRTKRFRVHYRKGGYYGEFEIARNNDLMIYYDGWLYFLRKNT